MRVKVYTGTIENEAIKKEGRWIDAECISYNKDFAKCKIFGVGIRNIPVANIWAVLRYGDLEYSGWDYNVDDFFEARCSMI